MKTIVVINRDSMGSGDKKLGDILIGAFLKKLWVKDEKPDAIIFYNSGVKLIVSGSAVLDALDGLETAGVELLACGTCIDFFQLKDKIKVGRLSDMAEIVNMMTESDKVITI